MLAPVRSLTPLVMTKVYWVLGLSRLIGWSTISPPPPSMLRWASTGWLGPRAVG